MSSVTKKPGKDRENLEITQLNEEAKKISLNAPLTKSFSLNGIDDHLFGKNSTSSSKSLYEKDVEALLEGLSMKIQTQECLGPKAIHHPYGIDMRVLSPPPLSLNFSIKRSV